MWTHTAFLCIGFYVLSNISWLCWVRGSLKSWEDIHFQWPQSTGIPSSFHKHKAPWSYSVRWVIQCHAATKPRYQVCHEVMCGFCSCGFCSWVCKADQDCGFLCSVTSMNGIEVLKLCCTKNNQHEAEFANVNLIEWLTQMSSSFKWTGSVIF